MSRNYFVIQLRCQTQTADKNNRHVRVHHSDKNEDDPQLSGVLSQKPEGPNKGRKRKAGSPPREPANLPSAGFVDEKLLDRGL